MGDKGFRVQGWYWHSGQRRLQVTLAVWLVHNLPDAVGLETVLLAE